MHPLGIKIDGQLACFVSVSHVIDYVVKIVLKVCLHGREKDSTEEGEFEQLRRGQYLAKNSTPSLEMLR